MKNLKEFVSRHNEIIPDICYFVLALSLFTFGGTALVMLLAIILDIVLVITRFDFYVNYNKRLKERDQQEKAVENTINASEHRIYQPVPENYKPTGLDHVIAKDSNGKVLVTQYGFLPYPFACEIIAVSLV